MWHVPEWLGMWTMSNSFQSLCRRLRRRFTSMSSIDFLTDRRINKRVSYGHLTRTGRPAFRKAYTREEFSRVIKIVEELDLHEHSDDAKSKEGGKEEKEEDAGYFPKVLAVDSDRHVLVWEACGEDLREEPLPHGGGGRLSAAQHLLRCVLRGIAALHTKHIIHCDVKTENVFRTGHRVVLGDFDLSNTPLRGTPVNLPPETNLSPARDVWGFGQLAFELLTGATTNVGCRANAAHRRAKRIWAGSPRLMPLPQAGFYWDPLDTRVLIHAFAADNLRREAALVAVDFIRPCLAEDPAHRPSLDALLGHKFFELSSD